MKKTAILKKEQKEFVEKFKMLSGRYSVRQIWDDWIVMSAISVANTCVPNEDREKRYLAIAEKYKPDELLIFSELLADMTMSLEEDPEQDFLGEMYMAVGMGSSITGQFFTPYHVCELLANLANLPNIRKQIEKDGHAMVNDCACGAGATLIAAANACRKAGIDYQRKVVFVGQDIDFICVCMCYLQLSLLGCPGYVINGNTLSEPVPQKGNIWYTPFWFLTPIAINGMKRDMSYEPL